MNTYRTADLTLSAFLQARGHDLLSVEATHGRGVFVFRDGADLQKDIHAWINNQTVSIPIRSFANGIRDLKILMSA